MNNRGSFRRILRVILSWTDLPVILTVLAGLAAAVGGILTSLVTAGILGGTEPPSPLTTPTPPPVISPSPTPTLLPTPTPTPLPTPIPTPTLSATPTLREAISLLQTELNSVRRQVSQLESDVKSLPKNTDQNQIESRLSNIEVSVTKLQNSVSKIETVVLGDPAKALEMTLLKKDMDNVGQEVSRLDNWNKWLLGPMFSLVIAILSLAASNFLSSFLQRPRQRPRGRDRS
jgi:hypothetical protein